MNRLPLIYLLLLSLLSLMACTDPKHVTETLHRAEALMDEHPDSALHLLQAVSPDEIGQNRNRAHYALLYTQAQDKNYIDETNDSLIAIAVDYYRDADEVRRKFLSYYYQGRVYFNAKDYLNATSSYMEAEQLAGAVGDDYLVGRLYAELGRIYRLYYDYPKSLEAYQKSAECYERAGKIRHRNYMWLNQSDICRNMNQYDESERLLRMALESAEKEQDESLVKDCLGSLVMQHIERGRMSKAKELYLEIERLVGKDYGSAYFMGQKAKMYTSEKDYVRARQSIEKGWERAKNRIDSVGLYFSSAELLKALGEDKSAYQELMKGVALQNAEAHQALQQPVLTVQRDYLEEKLELEAYRLQLEKKLRILSILLGVLSMAVMYHVFRKIIKKRNEEAQRTIRGLEKQKKETEKQKVQAEKDKELLEKENRKISSLLQKMDSEKRMADETIKNLKNDISLREKESNAEISGLLQKLKANKKESERSIASLKQKLVQKEKDSDALSSLLDDLENERNMALHTIQELNRSMTEKEESRQMMMSLVQNLENENKVNIETIAGLRESLASKERVHQLYEQKNKETLQDLQTAIGLKSGYISALLKDKFEFMGEWILLYEEELTLKNYRERKIKRAIEDTRARYFKGKNAFIDLEKQVNLYCDNAMLYFRKEVQLSDEKDYNRVCCLFAGIPPHIIAWMLGEKTDVVYQRKSRLRKKIASFPYLHQSLFFGLLPK